MNDSIKKRATRINKKTGFLEYADEPATKVYVNNYDITEDDVLNRAAMMSTGVYTVDTPQEVINQVNTQNAAIEEARRLAAIEVANAAARQAAVEEANRIAAQAAAEEQNRLWIAEQERLNAIRIAEGEAKAAEALRIREAEIAAQVEATRQATLAAELVTQRSNTAAAAAAAAAEIQAAAEYQAWVDRNQARWAQEAQEAALRNQAMAVQMPVLEATSASNPEFVATNPMINIPVAQQADEQKLIADVQNEIVEEENKKRLNEPLLPPLDPKPRTKLGWFEQIVEYVYTVIYKQD